MLNYRRLVRDDMEGVKRLYDGCIGLDSIS